MISFVDKRRLDGVRRFVVLGLVSMAAMVGVQSTLTPAYAASTIEGCPSGYLCLYTGANYNNHNGAPNAKYYHCGTVNLSGWVTRHGSFVDNQTGNVISAFWSGYNGTGSILWAIQSVTWSPDVDFYPVNSITVC
ncbi:MAG TPA: hypothetical protein VF526_18950 [Solirubrobacteraceae bacterium]